MMDQKELRRLKILERNAVSQETRIAWSDTICKNIISDAVYKDAGTLMIYQAIKGEVQLNFLEDFSKKIGKKLIYPLCTDHRGMVALHPLTKDAWVKGSFGIMEPLRECSEEITPEAIDLIICPCTVFDSFCNRIGMGGGYYDRFLPKCKNAVKVAASFEIQRADRIICQPWDIKMDMIFTERNIYRKSNGF